MPTETELKLTASPGALQALPRQKWLRKMCAGRSKKEKLVSVYFDTPDCQLQQHGIALRIRRQSGKRIQTIKSQDGGGALARGEWEQPVTGDRPDLKAAGKTPLAKVLKGTAKKAVRPVFKTEVNRITIPLRMRSSE